MRQTSKHSRLVWLLVLGASLELGCWFLVLRESRSLFRDDNKCDADGNEEEGKELATREGTDQLRVGFAEIFDDDSENRVANEKQASQNSVGLARAGPHKPQDPEQNDSFEKRLVKL